MELEKLTPGKHVYYQTHLTAGRMKIDRAERSALGSTWVVGFDKDKGREIKVYPSQCHTRQPW